MSRHTYLLNIFLLVLTYVHVSQLQRINLKICSKTGTEDVCQQLVRQNELACHVNMHSVDCLLNIENAQSHIGRISEEEAFLASNLVSNNVQIIGEIVNKDHAPSQTVIIAKNEILGSSDLKSILRNKKFCHPGFKHDDAFSFYLLQELENLVIDDNELCNNNEGSTLVENRIRVLSNFFGDSCRPGPWTQDRDLDLKLKNKYNSLCKLCNQENCNQDYNNDPFHDTLSCLTRGGDFVLTTLSEAQKFLQSSFNSGKYKYLCKDGSSKTDPCSWTEPLPSLIVAEKNHLSDVIAIAKKYLGNKLVNSTSSYSATDSVVTEAFIRILNLDKTETVKLLSTPKSLSEYVNERRPSPKLDESKKCNLSVKWCTRSAGEQAKCKWYSQAARNRAIQPVIECKLSEIDEELSCLDDIENGNADVVTTSADHAYLTLKKGLTSVAYPETDTRTLATILLVKHTSNGAINNINDLKGKKACLPQFGGKEYIAFIEAAKSYNAISTSSCNYEQDFSDFVGPSCVPGVGNGISEDQEDTNVNVKLCELCKPQADSSSNSVCSEDKRNLYYGSKGSLQCMKDKAADFAVITKPFRLINETYNDLQVICKNGSIAKYSGLNVDDDCALNVIISGEVVIKEDNVQKKNIILILQESEKWFGQDFNKPFQLFDRFNNTRDYLFRDSTLGLTYRDEQSSKFVQNYKDLLKHAETCFLKPDATTSEPGGNDDTTPSESAPIVATMMVLVVSAFASFMF